jgi:MFS family permease
MLSLARLAVGQPALRRHALNGAMGAGCVSAFWATYALHLDRTFHYGPMVAGLFGLVGIAGTLGAAFAGRQVDGGRFGPTFLVAAAGMALGFVCLWIGAANLVLFIIGVLLIDAAAGLNHASNQSSAMAIDPAARGRINSLYMASFFLGAAVYTALAALLYAAWGWGAVCALGVVTGALMFALQWLWPIPSRTPAAKSETLEAAAEGAEVI